MGMQSKATRFQFFFLFRSFVFVFASPIRQRSHLTMDVKRTRVFNSTFFLKSHQKHLKMYFRKLHLRFSEKLW